MGADMRCASYLFDMIHPNRSCNFNRVMKAGAAFGLIFAIGVTEPTQAEPLAGASPKPDAQGAAPRWSIAIEALAADAAEPADQGRRAIAIEPQRDNATRPRETNAVPARLAGLPMALASPGTLASPLSGDEDWRREIGHALKTAVHPAFEEITTLGLADAIRSIDSELGLTAKRSFDVPGSANSGQDDRPPGHRMAPGWDSPGHRSGNSAPARSTDQIEADRRKGNLLLQELIDEITPWALTALALYVLVYWFRLWLAFNRRKSMRRHKSGNSQRSRHRRCRRNQSGERLSPPRPGKSNGAI